MTSIKANRNSYLLKGYSCIKSYNPRIVNRLMDHHYKVITNYRNLEPPFLKLASTHPIMYSPNIDATRAKVAFGRRAIPKLLRQLYREDIFEVMQALNSLNDLVHDPEKGLDAVRFGIIDRLINLMLHEKVFVREKVCMILYSLAAQEAGRRAIMKRYKVLHYLARLIEDKNEIVRFKAQRVLEMVSFSPIGANALNVADFLPLILRIIGGSPKCKGDDTIIMHLRILKFLIDRNAQHTALEHNAMEILVQKLEDSNEKILLLALECIALLCHTSEGRAKAEEFDLGTLLCKKLWSPSMEVRIKAACTLAFATIQSNTRSNLTKKCTVDALIEIMENFHSSEGQLGAMKVLSNVAEDQKGKALVRKVKHKIKQVFTNNDKEVDRHRNLLLNMLKK